MAGNRPHLSAPARLGTYAGAAAAVVALDQVTKALVRGSLVPGKPVTLIPHVMDLSLVYNTGAAFSMGEGKGLLFVLVAAGIALGCAVLAWREDDVPVPLVVTLGCVAGGGVGNAIDRVVAGQVANFFATTFMDFAVFHVADIFLTCGGIIDLVLWVHWDREREAAGEDRP